jgi:hypothetical protein
MEGEFLAQGLTAKAKEIERSLYQRSKQQQAAEREAKRLKEEAAEKGQQEAKPTVPGGRLLALCLRMGLVEALIPLVTDVKQLMTLRLRAARFVQHCLFGDKVDQDLLTSLRRALLEKPPEVRPTAAAARTAADHGATKNKGACSSNDMPTERTKNTVVGVEEDWGVDCLRTEREIERELAADEKDEHEIAEEKRLKAEVKAAAVTKIGGGAFSGGFTGLAGLVSCDADDGGSEAGEGKSSVAGSVAQRGSNAGSAAASMGEGSERHEGRKEKTKQKGEDEEEGDEGEDEDDGDADGLDLDPYVVAQGRAVMVQRISDAQQLFFQAVLVLLQSKVQVKHAQDQRADTAHQHVDTGAAAALYYACQLAASLSITKQWRERVMGPVDGHAGGKNGMMAALVNVCLQHQQQRPAVEKAWMRSTAMRQQRKEARRQRHAARRQKREEAARAARRKNKRGQGRRGKAAKAAPPIKSAVGSDVSSDEEDDFDDPLARYGHYRVLTLAAIFALRALLNLSACPEFRKEVGARAIIMLVRWARTDAAHGLYDAEGEALMVGGAKIAAKAAAKAGLGDSSDDDENAATFGSSGNDRPLGDSGKSMASPQDALFDDPADGSESEDLDQDFLRGGDDDDGVEDDDDDDDTSRSLHDLLIVSRRLASLVLVNLSQSPANRTIMYKQELSLKANDARYDQGWLDQIERQVAEKRDHLAYMREKGGRAFVVSSDASPAATLIAGVTASAVKNTDAAEAKAQRQKTDTHAPGYQQAIDDRQDATDNFFHRLEFKLHDFSNSSRRIKGALKQSQEATEAMTDARKAKKILREQRLRERAERDGTALPATLVQTDYTGSQADINIAAVTMGMGLFNAGARMKMIRKHNASRVNRRMKEHHSEKARPGSALTTFNQKMKGGLHGIWATDANGTTNAAGEHMDHSLKEFQRAYHKEHDYLHGGHDHQHCHSHDHSSHSSCRMQPRPPTASPSSFKTPAKHRPPATRPCTAPGPRSAMPSARRTPGSAARAAQRSPLPGAPRGANNADATGRTWGVSAVTRQAKEVILAAKPAPKTADSALFKQSTRRHVTHAMLEREGHLDWDDDHVHGNHVHQHHDHDGHGHQSARQPALQSPSYEHSRQVPPGQPTKQSPARTLQLPHAAKTGSGPVHVHAVHAHKAAHKYAHHDDTGLMNLTGGLTGTPTQRRTRERIQQELREEKIDRHLWERKAYSAKLKRAGIAAPPKSGREKREEREEQRDLQEEDGPGGEADGEAGGEAGGEADGEADGFADDSEEGADGTGVYLAAQPRHQQLENLAPEVCGLNWSPRVLHVRQYQQAPRMPPHSPIPLGKNGKESYSQKRIRGRAQARHHQMMPKPGEKGSSTKKGAKAGGNSKKGNECEWNNIWLFLLSLIVDIPFV